MYSVVLAAMLTAGSAQPAGCFGIFSCGGCSCHGSYNAFSSSCSRNAFTCSGCVGCSGWHGSCHGCHGCYASCQGCYASCHGCYATGYGCQAVSGGYSGCYTCSGFCSGCNFSSGCNGCYGGKVIIKDKVPAPKPVEPKKASADQQGKVVVQLPADAKLYVDGQFADIGTGKRTFLTPALDPDADYYYTIKAEVVRDGRVVRDSKKVFVRAGMVSEVDFGTLGTPAIAQTGK